MLEFYVEMTDIHYRRIRALQVILSH